MPGRILPWLLQLQSLWTKFVRVQLPHTVCATHSKAHELAAMLRKSNGPELEMDDVSRMQPVHAHNNSSESAPVSGDNSFQATSEPSPPITQQLVPRDSSSRGELPPPKAAAARVAGDYEPVPFATIVWISYMSLICGCINAVSALTYNTYLTHITGVTTRLSIGAVDEGQAARVGFSTANFFGINIGYCAGALLNGLVLTVGTADKWSYIKLNYPSIASWKWQHQLLLSVSIVALSAAYGLKQSDLPNFPRYTTSVADDKSPAFLAAIILTTFAAAILNGFLTLNTAMVLRSSHHTGTLHDLFYFLGYSLRARNCRFVWKVKLLSCTYVCFITGACIGAAAYYSTFKNGSVLVPVIMLSPLWVLGAALLFVQARRARASSEASSMTCAPPLPAAAPTTAAMLASILTDIGSSQFLQAIVDDDRDDDSIKTLSKLKPERLSIKYGMSVLQAAAFLDKCRERTNAAPSAGALSASAATTRAAGEYEDVNVKHYVWAFYVSLVGGSINAFALQGIFEQTVTHVTGLSARVGIDLVHPRPAGSPGYSADEIAAMLIVFGIACFVCGFTLTTPGPSGNLQHLKMDYPKPLTWSWKHQFLLTFCCMCLLISHAIVVNSTHGDKHYIDTIAISEGSANLIFFEACLLCTAAAAMLNCFLSQGNLIPLRASHVTGTAHDIFLGLGFALRSRSLRLIWRVHLLSTTYVGFFIGGIIGSAVYSTDFGQYAVITPVIFLTPMWLCGCGFLLLQLRREYLRRAGQRGSRIVNDNFDAVALRQA